MAKPDPTVDEAEPTALPTSERAQMERVHHDVSDRHQTEEAEQASHDEAAKDHPAAGAPRRK